jgi:uncharacterized protein (TIGR00661 family)
MNSPVNTNLANNGPHMDTPRRILYGVQATGQGHISRARAMAAALAAYKLDITWLFSGRPRDRLFDMSPFGDFEHRRGLTFVTKGGQLRIGKTVLHNNIFTFISDVHTLNLDEYDLIVTDYEPVVAWAARLKGREVIGIGHQYAFGANTPVAGDNWLQRTVMQHFAPVQRPVGLHWAAFNNHTLPPILDLPTLASETSGDHVLVYLPFENQNTVTHWLQQFKAVQFKQYSPDIDDSVVGNVTRQKANIAGFKRDLANSRGVICNSGFELISECLHWQKPVLCKPLDRQMEQQSNAAALSQLCYATVMHNLDNNIAGDWLAQPPPAPQVRFSDVAAELAGWLAGGAHQGVDILSAHLWS